MVQTYLCLSLLFLPSLIFGQTCLPLEEYDNGFYIAVCDGCTLRTFWEADNYCMDYFNSYLASVHDSTDNSNAKNARDNVPNYGITYDAWMGGIDEYVEGTWEWADGTVWDYDNWFANEPNNYQDDQNCMIMGGNSNRWDDQNCDVTFTCFICNTEGAPQTAQPSSQPTVTGTWWRSGGGSWGN